MVKLRYVPAKNRAIRIQLHQLSLKCLRGLRYNPATNMPVIIMTAEEVSRWLSETEASIDPGR